MDPPADDGYAVQDELLDSKIIEDEVRKVICKLETGKAAGADQAITEFLKSAERIILPFLVKLCSVIFNRGIFSEVWAKCIMVLLYKKGDCDDPNNYQGIFLLSSLSKIFTSILKARLTGLADANTVFTEAQASFGQSYSTTDHIFTLHAIVEQQFSCKANLYVAFVDIY